LYYSYQPFPIAAVAVTRVYPRWTPLSLRSIDVSGRLKEGF